MSLLSRVLKGAMDYKSENATPSGGYDFTSDWFSGREHYWRDIFDQLKPRKLLEIGSYEGRSSVFIIEHCVNYAPIDFYCIDSWRGGIEHISDAMSDIESRFDRNIAKAIEKVGNQAQVHKIKSLSHPALLQLLDEHRASFDFIYVDGSHQAPDVLSDAILSFWLLRRSGVMIFDDYLWSMEPFGQQDPLNMPKPAIDAFINIFQRKLRVITGIPLYQIAIEKLAE